MKRQDHETFMRRAVELAIKGWGTTSPNPLVGAVVVKDGRVIGEGYHRRAGSPHAEINALARAGKAARGATLYVTLEPCSHHGRTPPCTGSIIGAGVKRVVIGSRDPHPLVNGRGIRQLRGAGIEVIVGVLRDACREINRAYETYVREGRPFVILKAALSLDGKIATPAGESRWITGSSCRDYVHRLRRGVDAIVVGGGTIRRDNPWLTTRIRGAKPHAGVAVVLDSALDIPTMSRIFARKPGELVLATTTDASPSRMAWARSQGYEVMVCPKNRRGGVSLRHLMGGLAERGVVSVLVEGGGEVFSDFVSNGFVDHVVACVAPKFIGGEGKDAFPGLSIHSLTDALQLKDVTVRSFDDDIVVEGSL